MDRFDVAVVGGGPAGARLAWRLARRSVRVALVDGSHPREKACGGGLTGRALSLVQDQVRELTSPPVSITAAQFEHRGRSATVPLAPGDLVVANRRDFDGTLWRAAIDAGATPVSSRALDVRREDHSWLVDTREGSLAAEWVIGADGANSLVRRRVATPFARTDLSVASGFYVHRTTDCDVSIGFEDEPAGYLWCFPRTDHLAVGVCAQADVSSPQVLLPIARRWIERNVRCSPSDLERYNWPIPSLGLGALTRQRPSGTGWMLVGDAAGMVDPITREGIFFALVAADAAATSLLESRDPAQEYARRARLEVYDEIIRAAGLKASFFRPQFMSLLIDALNHSAPVRAIMADLVGGRQTYRGLRRRLVATGELTLMLRLFTRRSARASSPEPSALGSEP